MRAYLFTGLCLLFFMFSDAQPGHITWMSTTQTSPFQKEKDVYSTNVATKPDVEVLDTQYLQTMDGFGGCFNELGWASLQFLTDQQRQAVMKELFEPGYGACFTLCRMPVGANDFSLQWYSYDETEGDFGMKNFTIAHDLKTLVSFIKNAEQYNPDLKLWASPWSPPQWMKYNKHYAEAMFKPGSKYSNDLKPEQVGKGGTNMFIQQKEYFDAYTLYFKRFISEYRKQGIKIGMIMPQNEFLSAQVFPSCTWTAAGLTKFIGYLGPQMQQLGVKLFYGTVNNGNRALVDTALTNIESAKYIQGIGFQWGGKNAIAAIHQQYPQLPIYQTEQECGNGKNDWAYCRYTWDLMKLYINNGAKAYMYWNISLQNGGLSHWGWAQNSLISVDSAKQTFTYNHEYYLLKHLSHFVKPGAKLLTLQGDFNNMLAFKNKDGSIVLVAQNEKSEDRQVNIKIGTRMYSPVLKADSFNTLVIDKNKLN